LELSLFSFLHHVLKVSWDDSVERAVSVYYRSDYNEGIFLLYKKGGGWGRGGNVGHLWPHKEEDGIELVTSQQELRVSVRDVQVD
jgi:hypothetical protein